MTEGDHSNVPVPADSSPAPPPQPADTTQAPAPPEAKAAAPWRRRWWRFLALGVPIAVLAIGGLALGFYLYVLGQATVKSTGVAKQQLSRAFASPLRLIDRVNVLIIGIDVTLDEKRRVLNVSRSDSLILTSFDPERRRVYVLSIPRDTRAEIPGHGTDKINAAYAYGGPRLAIKTVEKLLRVKIDFYVKLGPDSFRHIIDAIGGIDIDVEKDMKYTDTWAGYTIDLRKGFQHLNGQQATGYIRYRHDALGDIGRVDRQRRVMQTLMHQLKQPSSILAAPKLLRAFAENTQTTLTPMELMTLGWFTLRIGGSPLQEQTLPGTFAPLYWEPDIPKLRMMVADLFYGVNAEQLAGTSIEVLNGSGSAALGPQVVARIEALGFKSVKLRPGAPADVTTIFDRTGHPRVVRMLATTLPKSVIKREAAAPKPTITILLARDAAQKISGGVIKRNGN